MNDIQAANAKALLIAAAGVGDQEMLRSLMAQHQYSDKDLSEVLAWACNEGQAGIVLDMLVKGVAPDEHCMFSACYSGHGFIVSQLLKCGGKMTPACVNAAQQKRNGAVLEPSFCQQDALPFALRLTRS
jgi:hypothetical protein